MRTVARAIWWWVKLVAAIILAGLIFPLPIALDLFSSDED